MNIFHKQYILYWINKISIKYELSDYKKMSRKYIQCQNWNHSIQDCIQIRYMNDNYYWKYDLS